MADPATNDTNRALPAASAGPVVIGILMLLLGVTLVIGGAWLLALGGSAFYAVAGAVLVVVAVMLFRRGSAALLLYALLLLATGVWAVWEAGLDWWPLAARLDVFFIFGLLLLTPWVTRALVAPRVATTALAGVVIAAIVLAVVAGTRDLHDRTGTFASAATAAPAPASSTSAAEGSADEWQAYGRTGYGQRYSPLTQFTPADVGRLQVAWQFRTGDMRGRPGDPEETTYEVTPLKVGNRLFLCTPHQSVIALDATTGRQLWRYDPQIQPRLALQHLTCRGVAYQPPPTGVTALATPASAPPATSGQSAQPVAATSGAVTHACPAKLFMATADGRLVALNPDTGAVCRGFGGGAGQIDLWAHMPYLMPGSYYSTSPVVVTRHLARNLVVVGGTVLDNYSTKEPSGVIRAFDAETGELVWNWDAGHPSSTAPIAAGQQYSSNSPNSWSVSSLDEALGLVYVPMGNQPPDQWGGQRSAAVEKASSSVVALDLATGQPRWIFQTVHHDLWDYDVPAQPVLVDLSIAGATVPALVQATKQGELFVLDRRTGTPILPVSEVPAPGGAAAGDHSAPSQPKSALSFDPPRLTGADMWGGTIVDQMMCRIQFHKLRYEGRFTPPSTQGSLIYPGNFGVFNWGSVAVDPVRQRVFATPTYLAFVSRLVPRPNATANVLGAAATPPLPTLNENYGAPFAAQLGAFLSPLGIPCQQPPWGYVAGADLRTGQVVWQHRNGTVRDLSPVPVPIRMGVPNLGGPLLTAGGVAFLSGSMDDYVRAYDVADGRQLWQSRLPAGGQATPMTYAGVDGRQYLVVVAGGHGSTHTRPGDYVIAYALPAR